MRLFKSCIVGSSSKGLFIFLFLLAVSLASGASPSPSLAITNLSVNGGVGKVKWAGTPNVMYQVECVSGLGGTWVPVDAPTTNATVSNVVTTSSAFYRVADYTNTTQYKANYTVNSKDKAAPTTPSNLTYVVASCTSVSLSWSASTDLGTK